MLMKMHAAGRSFVFALCFICVSLNDEKSCGHFEDFCEKISMTVSIGTSVLLPCNLQPHSSNWVTWSHAATKQAEMVQLSSQGHVKFLDPRNGRVKVFSNEQRDGNYSIRIDELEISDLGCYHCGQQCVQVQLPETGLSSSQGFQPLISIVTRVAAVLLLCVGGYCCYKCISHCNNKTKDSANSPTTAGSEVVSKEKVCCKNTAIIVDTTTTKRLRSREE